MASFSNLVRFESGGSAFYFDLGAGNSAIPRSGDTLSPVYTSVDDLISSVNSTTAVFDKLLAPVYDATIPIYCVGLNYRSHAAEASLTAPTNPPLWTKPAAALANPEEGIPISPHCAAAFLDYEGELVFCVARECRDVSPSDAESYILGYTIGNDLSCRLFQLPDQCGGQFFYSKAFDKFAPIGPVLTSPEEFARVKDISLRTSVNGVVKQVAIIAEDMIFSCATILSFMSQGSLSTKPEYMAAIRTNTDLGTTIPAGTMVMTGTPAGVGAFQQPRSPLKDGDVVEVQVSGIGTLKNHIVFEK